MYLIKKVHNVFRKVLKIWYIFCLPSLLPQRATSEWTFQLHVSNVLVAFFRNLPCSPLQRDTHTDCQARRISRCFVILNRITNSTFSQPRAQILLLFVQSLVSPLPLSSPASLSSLSLSLRHIRQSRFLAQPTQTSSSFCDWANSWGSDREGRAGERASERHRAAFYTAKSE